MVRAINRPTTRQIGASLRLARWQPERPAPGSFLEERNTGTGLKFGLDQ